MLTSQTRSNRLTCVALAIVAMSAPNVDAGDSASLTWLGYLPEHTFLPSSISYGVSADGSVVVGTSTAWQMPSRAFRWTGKDGMLDLGSLPGDASAIALGVSADGSVVVGASGQVAVMWASTGGVVDLGTLPGHTSSIAWSVSGDGLVVVGSSGPWAERRAFRWTAERGMVDLGVLPGYSAECWAYHANQDGSVIVGTCRSDDFVRRAFRWTSDEGMVDLGTLPDHYESGAGGVSADGTAVVGWSGPPFRAFRWTNEGGMVDLGVPAGYVESYAADGGVSADGARAVGGIHAGGSEDQAFLWHESTGIVNLHDYLHSLGIDLTGMNLHGELVRISQDGRNIAGFGYAGVGSISQAWIATIPAITQPCATADLNCDGVVDGADLLILLSAWGQCADCDDCPADLDGSCVVDGADLLILLSNWG